LPENGEIIPTSSLDKTRIEKSLQEYEIQPCTGIKEYNVTIKRSRGHGTKNLIQNTKTLSYKSKAVALEVSLQIQYQNETNPTGSTNASI
jgi:hypothetical protein